MSAMIKKSYFKCVFIGDLLQFKIYSVYSVFRDFLFANIFRIYVIHI